MATLLEASGVGVVTRLNHYPPREAGKKDTYKVHVSFLEMGLDVFADEDVYRSLHEGAEVQVTGTPYAREGQLNLRGAQIVPAVHGGSNAAAPPRSGRKAA